jgi:hypothetical protein
VAVFLLGGLAFGAFFGLAQWLVLRRYLGLSWVWFLAPLVGLGALMIGFLTGLFFYPAAANIYEGSGDAMTALGVAGGFTGGAFVGIVQAILFCRWLKEYLWIIPASGIGGALFVLVGGALGPQADLGALLGGFAYGLVTGPVLEWQRSDGVTSVRASSA